MIAALAWQWKSQQTASEATTPKEKRKAEAAAQKKAKDEAAAQKKAEDEDARIAAEDPAAHDRRRARG